MPATSPAHASSSSSYLRRAVIRPHKDAKPRPIVVDAGLSRLTATLCVIVDGYSVTVVERKSLVGGRCASEPVTVNTDGQMLTAILDTDVTV